MGPYELQLVEARRARLQRFGILPTPQPEEPTLVPEEPVNNVVSCETPIEPRSLYEEPIKPKQTMRRIIATVARRYGLTENDMASACRLKKVVIPRHIACYLARKLTLQSMPQIGRVLGDRDHTTILSAVNKITRMRDEDMHFAALLEDIERDLTGGFDE